MRTRAPTSIVAVDAVVERAAQPAGRREGLDLGDHGPLSVAGGVGRRKRRADRLPGRQVAVGRALTRRVRARLDPRGPPCFWSSEDSAPPSVPATGGPLVIGSASETAFDRKRTRIARNDHIRTVRVGALAGVRRKLLTQLGDDPLAPRETITGRPRQTASRTRIERGPPWTGVWEPNPDRPGAGRVARVNREPVRTGRRPPRSGPLTPARRSARRNRPDERAARPVGSNQCPPRPRSPSSPSPRSR